MRLLLAFALLGGLSAQTTDRTISVPVSRSVQVRQDQVTVAIYLRADPSASLDAVLEAIGFSGGTASDLQQFDLGNQGYTHRFLVNQPSERFPEIMWGLAQLQAIPPDSLKSVYYSMALTVSQAQTDNTRRGLMPDLEREGPAAAQQLAGPMGVHVGVLLSVDSIAVPGIVTALAVNLRQGDFYLVP